MKMVVQVFLKTGHEFNLVLSHEAAVSVQTTFVGDPGGILSGTTLDAVGYNVRVADVSALLFQTEDELQKKHRQFQQQAPRNPAQQTIPLHGSPGPIFPRGA